MIGSTDGNKPTRKNKETRGPKFTLARTMTLAREITLCPNFVSLPKDRLVTLEMGYNIPISVKLKMWKGRNTMHTTTGNNCKITDC